MPTSQPVGVWPVLPILFGQVVAQAITVATSMISHKHGAYSGQKGLPYHHKNVLSGELQHGSHASQLPYAPRTDCAKPGNVFPHI